MSEQKEICLYIPSLYRAEALLEVLFEIRRSSIPDWCSVIVAIERFKDPESWRIASSFADVEGLQVINGLNQGFAGAFLHVFEVSDARYVMHLADEESPDLLALKGLIPFLQHKLPDALITNFEIIREDCTSIKYRAYKDHLATASDLLYCMHNPGMLWSTEKVKKLLPVIYDLKNRFPTIYTYYPHLLILTLMMTGSSVFFHSAVVSRQVRFFEKNHEVNSGGDFKSFSNRWCLLSELNSLAKHLESYSEYRPIIGGLRRAVMREVFPMLRRAYANEKNLTTTLILKSALMYWSGFYRLTRYLKRYYKI